METAAMNGWIDHLRREVDRLGTTGVVGIALLVFAAGFYFSTMRPAEYGLEDLRGEATDLERQFRMSGSLSEREATPSEQLAAFYAFFPSIASTPELLRNINAAAQAKGIELQSGDYRMQPSGGGPLARYEITLPIKGSYAQIRGFVGDVLAAIPAAVLEDVSLRRDSVENTRLEARVRFTVYLGGPA
jgi:Tfp pilus assembly protein PilO